MTCATCGHELPAGTGATCPRCLLQLGLAASPAPMPDRLGAYTIVARLGEGGMGEVYRARDSRLDRDVAIKVLPDLLAGDPERTARFRREAKVAASLNHPNIAAVYGFEDDDGTHFLVMELVEGVTLAERLKSGALPLDEALALAAQIAAGLEAAHENGIVHRDLKPGNIKITPAGQAKILDFGLAKVLDPAPAARGSDAAITGHYTSPGTVFGTVPYMSPEQARGRVVDKRSDIWALGCVLYECLSGRRAFEGDTPTDVVAKIVEREPDWSALPKLTPPRVRELLDRCLSKDPLARIRDSGDVRIELERALSGRDARRDSAGSRRILPWAVAAIVAVAAVTWMAMTGGGSIGMAGKPATPFPVHVVVTDPDVPHVAFGDASTVAISPDGTTIAYTGKGPTDTGERLGLYVRRLDEIHARRLELPCDAQVGRQLVSDPFFSPDGTSIGFSCGNLYRIALSGGSAVPLIESEIPLKGATWGPRGIVVSPAAKSGLVLVKESGGPLETLTVPDAAHGEVSHRWPSALPDGRHVLFTIKKEGITTFDQAEIALLDLETGTYTTLIHGGTFARYLPTGQIVFARGSSLMAVGFDLAGTRIVGQPVPVEDGVMTEPGSGAAQYAVAQDTGTLVFVPGGAAVVRNDLAWIDRHGTLTPIDAPAQSYHTTYVSPDGTHLASTVFGATDGVSIYDIEHRSQSRLKTEGNSSPVGWSPDGRDILYGTDHDGLAFVLAAADGSTPPRRLDIDVVAIQSMLLVVDLPEGRGLVYASNGGLWFFPVGPGATARRLGDLPFGVTTLALSPDHHWLAYNSSASGRSEIYIRSFPSGGETWQVSRAGGHSPSWVGGELFFLRDAPNDRWLCASRIEATGNRIVASAPVELFKVPDDGSVWGPHPDGRRFVFVRRRPPEFKGDRVEAILNWSQQVRARTSGR